MPGLSEFLLCCATLVMYAGVALADTEAPMESLLLTPTACTDREHLQLRSDGSFALEEGWGSGYCVWDITRERAFQLLDLSVCSEVKHVSGFTPAGDIIVQVRTHKEDGTNGRWTEWWPQNLLRGGSFRDATGNGIPDGVDILEFGEQGRLWTDNPREGLSKWFGAVFTESDPPMVSQRDGNSIFRFCKARADGQTIVQMHSDRVPTAQYLTVSGWNGWDLGNAQTMGLMSRFHEIDAQGRRLNKLMFIGDDDWNQPGGISPLMWRAVTFKPRRETRRLNLYAARLISSSGTLECAKYQVHQDSLASEQHLGVCLKRFDRMNSEEWSFSDPDLSFADEHSLQMRPHPHSNSSALGSCFALCGARRVCVIAEMDVQVPERYDDHDPSHKAWASSYLELLDSEERVAGVVKVSVCRPRFGDELACAGEVPSNAVKARLRLVASHQSYLQPDDRKNMDGEMFCRWSQIRVFESRYPQEFRTRLDEDSFRPGEVPLTRGAEVRAIVLGDSSESSPVLRSIRVELNTR